MNSSLFLIKTENGLKSHLFLTPEGTIGIHHNPVSLSEEAFETLVNILEDVDMTEEGLCPAELRRIGRLTHEKSSAKFIVEAFVMPFGSNKMERSWALQYQLQDGVSCEFSEI